MSGEPMLRGEQNATAQLERDAKPRIVQPRRKYNPGRSPTLVMRTVYIDGRHTTVRLESVIWCALKSIARAQEMGLHDLVSAVNRNRIGSNLTSAIRACVVAYLIAQAPPEALPTHLFHRN